MSPVAVDIYRSFAAQRKRLDLAPAVLQQLGRTLEASGHPEDAAWCLKTAGQVDE